MHKTHTTIVIRPPGNLLNLLALPRAAANQSANLPAPAQMTEARPAGIVKRMLPEVPLTDRAMHVVRSRPHHLTTTRTGEAEIRATTPESPETQEIPEMQETRETPERLETPEAREISETQEM